MSNPQQQISLETALRLLTNQQRRRIIRRVADTPDGTTVDHLTTQPGVAPDGNGSVAGLAVELHHVHVPMLQDANVIEYDDSREVVRRGQQFQAAASLLAVIDDHWGETPPSGP